MSNNIEERSQGILLGLTCGDILGARVEGMEAVVLAGTHGKVVDFLPAGGDEGNTVVGVYTDDTQMTIALAESIVNVGEISLI